MATRAGGVATVEEAAPAGTKEGITPEEEAEPVQGAGVGRAAPGLQSLTQLRALPFLPEPSYRRFVRNVPGDAGFDPLGLAGSGPHSFTHMLEAETKHGRIAMLAGIGFVAPEVLHERLSGALGLPDLMAEGGCTPTLLNGGLEEPILIGSLAAIFGIMAFADLCAPRGKGLPGYYGFDPLNFGDVVFSDLAKSMLRGDVEWVAEAETKHGRIAMVAVTYMAIREWITETPTWPSL